MSGCCGRAIPARKTPRTAVSSRTRPRWICRRGSGSASIAPLLPPGQPGQTDEQGGVDRPGILAEVADAFEQDRAAVVDRVERGRPDVPVERAEAGGVMRVVASVVVVDVGGDEPGAGGER